MWRWGLVALVLACSCQPGGSSTNNPKPSSTGNGAPFVPKSDEPTLAPSLSATEEAQVIAGAMDEFFTNRWQDWNVGEFVALEPAWTVGQFDSTYFDKALDFWIVQFGNDGDASEGTLKRIRETLIAANSPLAVGSKVEKPLDTMDLGPRIVIVPPTYFSNSAAWVPGAVLVKNRANMNGGIRAKGALSYPLFSGDGHYAFLQMNHVGAGNELGQLHFFMVKIEGKWKALAVGRIAE
jgi:hypothetical protein